MAKKHKNIISRPPQFRNTPFSTLNGVKAPEKPAVPPNRPQATEPLKIEDDGAELFRQAVADVKRLQPGEPSPVPRKQQGKAAPDETPVTDDNAADLFLQEISRMKLEVKFTDILPDEEEMKPLPGNRLRQLKRGIVSINHQLDLHGLTREEALKALPHFLHNARLKSQKAVLIITGKGNNSSGEPVLQQAVASWLRDAGREQVLEFAPAPREMGGSGAYVVFLRPASDKKA